MIHVSQPQASHTAPFSRFEWMIAWRYLRAKRSEGGVSTMTWISLIGITLAVAALIITLAVRAGFRYEFVDTILGANAHVTVYSQGQVTESGAFARTMADYDAVAETVAGVEGVSRAAPLVKGQVLAAARGRNAGVQIFGISPENLQDVRRVVEPEEGFGSLDRFGSEDIFGGGIAIGAGVARELGVAVGDKVNLISPNGAKNPFGGTSPRIAAYEVVYIFRVGRYDIDRVRIYMPFAEAQSYFNREGMADEIEIILDDPEDVTAALTRLQAAVPGMLLWSWQDSSGAFLRALQMEDNVMFLILSVLVLIASMNIVSGLIMLVKNKGRDIGILRTMGLSEGSVLRVFFICGASVGVVGTIAGLILGCLFAIYIDPIFDFVNWVAGGGVWDPSVRLISRLPARLEMGDVMSAISLSLFLSFFVTLFPARRAARMNPVEALRYE